MKKLLFMAVLGAVLILPKLAPAASYGSVSYTAATIRFFQTDNKVAGVTTTSSTVIPAGINVLRVIPGSKSGGTVAFSLWDLPVANPVSYTAGARSLGTFYVTTTELGKPINFATLNGSGGEVGIPIQGRLGILDASGATTATVKVLYNRGASPTTAQPSY